MHCIQQFHVEITRLLKYVLSSEVKGFVEDLSNFTYLVFAGIASFRLCVFRSVSVIFIICFEEKKLYVNFSKSKFIVLLSYYLYVFEQCFGCEAVFNGRLS